MCLFSQEVNSVEKTRIFARRAGNARQYLVYSMSYSSASDLAMILPLPIPPSSREDAVRFIDLSGYEEFFDDLERGFLPPLPEFTLSREEVSLNVYDVGSFEASFVPSLADFARLDARFRLTGDVWSRLPDYADYGFAVFKLKPGARSVHPIAFEFPTRAPEELFFPTVHVHDGNVHPTAQFDHILYCQSDVPFSELDISWKYPRSLMRFWLDCASPYNMFHRGSVPSFKEWEISWKYPGSLSRFELNRATPAERLRDKREKGPPTNEKYRAERTNPANYIKAKEFVSMERAQDIVDPDLHILRKEMAGICRNMDVVLRS